MLTSHSLQIPALTGDLLFLLLLVSLEKPPSGAAANLCILAVHFMEWSFSSNRNAGENTLFCFCVYSSVPCWLYLWLRRLGYGSQSHFFWDWAPTITTGTGGTAASPRSEKTSLWLWILACNHSKAHLRSNAIIGQISSSQKPLHGK